MAPIYTEIADIRSEPMRVVKRIIFIIIITVTGCVSSRHYHKTLQGTFYEKYTPINYGASYRFSGDAFKLIVVPDIGPKSISGGTFSISGDTLLLNYKPMEEAGLPSYKIIRRTPFTDTLNVSESLLGTVTFKILNRKGKALSQAVDVIARDTKQRVIHGYSPDSLGRITDVPLDKLTSDYLIHFLAHKPVIIPADTLTGYRSLVQVFFSPVSYSNYNGATKYLIKKATSNRLILKRLNYTGNFKRLVLQREDSL